MEFKARKKIRIPGYDYSTSGYYFVTVCTEQMKEILSRIRYNVGTIVPDGPCKDVFKMPDVILANYGKIVEKQIEIMTNFYDEIHIDKYVIMPNHIHFLLEVRNGIFGPSGTMVPTMYSVISRFIGTFKRFTNKEIGKNIWQARSYDHVIRSEKDYLEICSYIEYNPLNWDSDILNKNKTTN